MLHYYTVITTFECCKRPVIHYHDWFQMLPVWALILGWVLINQLYLLCKNYTEAPKNGWKCAMRGVSANMRIYLITIQ